MITVETVGSRQSQTVLNISLKFKLDEENVPRMSWDTGAYNRETGQIESIHFDFVLASRDRRVELPTPEAERIAATCEPPYGYACDPLVSEKAYFDLNPYGVVSAEALERMRRGNYSGSAGMVFIAGQVGILGQQEMISHAERHGVLQSLGLIENEPYDAEPLHKPARRRPRSGESALGKPGRDAAYRGVGLPSHAVRTAPRPNAVRGVAPVRATRAPRSRWNTAMCVVISNGTRNPGTSSQGSVVISVESGVS